MGPERARRDLLRSYAPCARILDSVERTVICVMTLSRLLVGHQTCEDLQVFPRRFNRSGSGATGSPQFLALMGIYQVRVAHPKVVTRLGLRSLVLKHDAFLIGIPETGLDPQRHNFGAYACAYGTTRICSSNISHGPNKDNRLPS